MYDIPKDDPAWDIYEGEEWINNSDIPQDVKIMQPWFLWLIGM